MISKNAVANPFNRGDYIVGAPTPPRYAGAFPPVDGPASFEIEPVAVPEDLLAQLNEIADDVITSPVEVVAGTRDWWAGSMIPDTEGRPATPNATIVRVSSSAQISSVLKAVAGTGVPVTVSAGRSNVTGAALPVRGGIVLDVCGLNRIVGYDPVSQIVEVEAGVFGDVFEAAIQADYGVTMGHWPSSYAISTVGGWVACRGAGQLSTRYGKIEDMVYGLDVVLPNGDEVSLGDVPRAALGPDLAQLFIGSEGTLGVVTRVRFKVHRLPDYGRAVAYGFDSFAAGLEACRELLQNGANPAALRLYDELESGVQFGLPDTNVLMIADEGNPRFVDANIETAVEICQDGARRLDGDAIFERWLDTRYLTGKSSEGFVPSPGFVSDTLEMVGRWRDLPAIYDEVVSAVNAVPGTLAASAHQSHAYTDGACLYFSLRGEVEPSERAAWYRAVWDAANTVLLRFGAGLSHHHGVGLLRSPYLRDALGGGHDVLRAVKHAIDPANTLNPGKLGLPDGTERPEQSGGRTYDVIARYSTLPGEGERVIGLLRDLAAASRREPENVSYEVFRSIENEHELVLLESYSSPEGFEQHRSSPHFEDLGRGQIIPLLTSRRVNSYELAR
jgi:alkyldihydroxyacetonephosphate synthase